MAPDIDFEWWEYPGHVQPRSAARTEATLADYELIEDGAGIVCHECGNISHEPNDIAERYCGSCNTFLGDDDRPMQRCPASGEIIPYRGTRGAQGVICPGCGRSFPLRDVWRPKAEGYELDEGRVAFPEHAIEGPIERTITQGHSDRKPQRYGGVTSRRYRP